jgi:polyisoprenyl-phosphate glycosyltransferase
MSHFVLRGPVALSSQSIVILIPVFNDWTCLGALLTTLDRELALTGTSVKILVVDDRSTVPPPEGLAGQGYQAIDEVEVLELRRNLGHQRAIAIGLAYLEDRESCGTVVIMDSDGEDAPHDVPRLLLAYHENACQKIVFAERAQRSESRGYRLFYGIYKLAYKIMTGRTVRFGNFSVVPRRSLSSLVAVSEMWNHYVAAVLKSREPFCTVSTHRGTRTHGEGKMNFVGLVIHGLSAISVDSDMVGVRSLVFSLVMIVMAIVGLVVIVAIRLATNLAIPGWATVAAGVITILLFQFIMLAINFSFITLSGRNGSFFLPKRDYAYFVARSYSLWPRR